ncbi:MAG: hypothetical protein ACRCSK_04600 [Fusobacteriaceae bacterium]
MKKLLMVFIMPVLLIFAGCSNTENEDNLKILSLVYLQTAM